MPGVKGKSGRKSGFKHSSKTRDKIAKSLLGRELTDSHKLSIAQGRRLQLLRSGIVPSANSKEYQKGWRAKNVEHVRKYMRDYFREHPEKNRENARQWRINNPDKEKARWHKRRSRKKNQSTSFAPWMLRYYRWSQQNRCIYCGTTMTQETSFDKETLEHTIPLSKGGLHSWENTALACSFCNSSKGSKLTEEWEEIRAPVT